MGSICYLHSIYQPSSSCLPSIQLLPNIQFPPDIHDAAPARHPTPAYSLASARHLSNSCLPSSSCPLSLCLGFSFSSRLIVLLEVARVEEVGSSEVGSWGKVSLLDSSASRCRERRRRGWLWVLGGFSVVPSRRVPSRRVRVLEAGQRRINVARVQILFMAVVTGRAVTERAVLGLSVPHRQVRSRVTPSKVRSRFAACSTGRSGLALLRALQEVLIGRSVGRVAVRCRRQFGLTTS